MATLDELKEALRREEALVLPAASSPQRQPLSSLQYSAGFNVFTQGPGWEAYRDFVVPQLARLLTPLVSSRVRISVLEVGPGPKSVLGNLPALLRRGIRRYAALEPNGLFAARLEEWLRPPPGTAEAEAEAEAEPPLPSLEDAWVRSAPFSPDREGDEEGEKFDVVLFCHSMYGMKPKRAFIERALEILAERPDGDSLVIVFHRDGTLQLDGLVCHQTASFPTGAVGVPDEDGALDCFAPFIAGHVMQSADEDSAVRLRWREVCRALGRPDEAAHSRSRSLLFSAPDVMVSFTRGGATALPELLVQVPAWPLGDCKTKTVKNREARLHRPAAVMRPTSIRHVQQCVRWALQHGVGLAVIGGGHSGHCVWPNVVSVDMEALDQLHIFSAAEQDKKITPGGRIVVAEAGCKTEDIIRKTAAAGLTVPLGSRPSVGAGLWLQGGIGHLSRLHGLACDAIVGAVLVSVISGQVFCAGCVPSQHWPAGAVRPDNDKDLLWALRGAGTNFGIVVSVTLQAHAAPTYSVRNWRLPLSDGIEVQRKLCEFDAFLASTLPRNLSADAYLYSDAGQLHLGVTMIETTADAAHPPAENSNSTLSSLLKIAGNILGPEDSFQAVDGLGLFETEMYMSAMHGGHGGGKTSSFKRCLFLTRIGGKDVAQVLVEAVQTRPTPLCYLHLLQGGRAIRDVATDATAFGCRDWDFACVITAVWPRDQDGTETARAAMRWVYRVVQDLLPLSSGAYGADLGPDPRDAALAAKAFGLNWPRLARLKHVLDPSNVLAFACPLPKLPVEPQVIVLVTGESGVGKDYCADIWASVIPTFITPGDRNRRPTTRIVSISEAAKREYAAATGADPTRLLHDRAYKEQHRPALTAFFQSQVRQRSRLPQEHFLNVVQGAADVDVLLITGMREEAPVAMLSYLVPSSRLLEVRVKAGKETRRVRRGYVANDDDDDDDDDNDGNERKRSLDEPASLVFDNESAGHEAARAFAKHRLLPFFHEDLQRLAYMVRPVPDFPRPGIEFRHVLDICQQPGGLNLCTSLLQAHFSNAGNGGCDWANVGAVACCEAGSFVFASALAARVNVPLVLIRKARKLPPPTVSATKFSSHISSSAANGTAEESIEMGRHAVPSGAQVVVVDDVLATGQTLCAVLRLFGDNGIRLEDVTVMVVAEFPAHRGRLQLRQSGFGKVRIQSLLLFSGA